MTQQVSHSFLVYILHVIRTLLYSTGIPAVSVCVESQLSYLLPAESLSRVVSQTQLLSSLEFLSLEWSTESESEREMRVERRVL